MKKWRREHPKEDRQRQRKYALEHPETVRARGIRWRKKNPDKTRVEKILQYQVRIGNIINPGACSLCGETEGVEAHHPDYSKPLDVVWMCRPCHVHIHIGGELVVED